jgi:hypothetical protein
MQEPDQADFFKPVTNSVLKKRQQHMDRVLKSFNKNQHQPMETSMDQGDVEMEDASSSFGFRKAGGGGNDFSFMKRKVRVNAVDKDIKEY